MEIKDNFSVFGLFITKKVKIFVNKQFFYIQIPTIKDFYTNDTLNAFYHICTASSDELNQLFRLSCKNSFDLITKILFQMGPFKEFSNYVDLIKETLPLFVPEIEIDYQEKQLVSNGITITEEV